MSSLFRDNIEKMTGYTAGFQPADRSVIKINTNENPYPPSPKVTEAIASLSPERLRLYPPQRWDGVRSAAAEVLGVDPELIVCGNGGDEILTMLVRCCCDASRPLAYPTQTYSLYPELAAIQDCPVVEVPFEDYHEIPARLGEAQAGLTILCNPNAPTGTLVPVDKVARLARQVKGVLLIDEAYVDFAQGNCLALLSEFDNVVILRSFSKGYSLAGLRCGLAIGSARIVEAMMKVKDSYNVNVVTQVAVEAALRDQDYFQANVAKIVKERQRLIVALREMGIKTPDSQTNFVLSTFSTPAGTTPAATTAVTPAAVPAPAVTKTVMTAREVYDALCERGIYVRYFGCAGLQDKLRITVGTAQQNDALLAALKECYYVGP